ncbi:MAG: methyltransferase domain-containing protein [Rhodospirillales bacterium]|jgi:ubiquinone/menaquinone biosynthesis C-methylase UbiE|nr:methyltransferase domain-containing protein [Rhodospirillales bacterium]MBT4039361.1 methyltransferase domain-containing protein [Rhodospirillales bacterium]MBT4626237.1 methyltransferase domain-containing protein [Rhodospirillales bacterium]MBT5353094.1 methyltransferase domain-containing protein [Rhodospirillales bacterium]MBT5520781.1 methyltransferase domain-containing protein [Rhodospirillales bacterium]
MPGNNNPQGQYSDAVIAGIELVYGEGFLSPGGEESVHRITEGLDLEGRDVLEIGCGLGGGVVALARNHGARRVHGIDLEASVLSRARERVRATGLEDRIELEQVEPGPFPIPDASYDVVVCKEMLCHIEDKPPFYAEICRVIRPGGYLIGSDWLYDCDGPGRAAYTKWCDHLCAAGLNFFFASEEQTTREIENAGFENVELKNNSDWITNLSAQYLEKSRGPLRSELTQSLGDEGYEDIVIRAINRLEALQGGALVHCNLRARKPR